MDNPDHLLVETPEGNRSRGMRQWNGVDTQGFNRRHKRISHLWQGRFQAVILQKDRQLLAAFRDVVRNPVRATAQARYRACGRPGR